MEKDKKVRLLLLFLIIFFIIVLIITAVLLYKIREEKQNTIINNNIIIENGISSIGNFNNNVLTTPNNKEKNYQEVKNRTIYFTVKDCADRFISYISSNNAFNTYIVLDNSFKSKKIITQENVLGEMEKMKPNTFLKINHMYVGESKTYYIDGRLIYKNLNNVEEKSYYLTIKLDDNTNTFSIIPGKEYLPKSLNITEDINTKYTINNNVSTSSNGNTSSHAMYDSEEDYEDGYIEEEETKPANVFEYKEISDSVMTRYYFIELKQNLQNNIEQAYEQLNEEYKKAKFENSIEKFKEYINQNKKLIETSVVDKYIYTKAGGINEFICQDKNGNKYIFQETAVFQYHFMLDEYTVGTYKFLGEYDNASNEKKAQYCIDRWIQAINNKDYSFAFNKLDETFRKNKFGNLNGFIEYIQNNLFNNNAIMYQSTEENKDYDVVSCEATIINNSKDGTNKQNIEIIIKPNKENADFTMSFSFK